MVINPIVGVYIPIIRIPIKGWMTIPNTRSLDPGSMVNTQVPFSEPGTMTENPDVQNPVPPVMLQIMLASLYL